MRDPANDKSSGPGGACQFAFADHLRRLVLLPDGESLRFEEWRLEPSSGVMRTLGVAGETVIVGKGGALPPGGPGTRIFLGQVRDVSEGGAGEIVVRTQPAWAECDGLVEIGPKPNHIVARITCPLTETDRSGVLAAWRGD